MSIPIFPLRSNYMACSRDNVYFLGIKPQLKKDLSKYVLCAKQITCDRTKVD